ncbi:MAG: glycosyltransferase [Planctomycetes bacterium]|nr:glycosyltransferase [Planctomycetota bacterium]MBI3843282.1 glycosyltransferase [Planctomycetota bacterium]
MFNAEQFIELCVTSLLVQTLKDIEIVCIDDHSEDDTYGRVVDRFGADRRLSAIRLARTIGPYQIKNWVASRLSRAEFVAMQDADDASHPHRLQTQLASLERTGTAVCGTAVHQFFPPNLPPRFGDPCGFGPDRTGVMHSLARYDSQSQIQEPVGLDAVLGHVGKDYVAKHGSQVFRRSLLLKFGAFDGRTRLGADTDINWRLLRFMPIHNIREVLYSRRHHSASLTRHPLTGIGSAIRAQYVARRNCEHERIRSALENEDMDLVRALCTADCYCGDVTIEAVHANWDLE